MSTKSVKDRIQKFVRKVLRQPKPAPPPYVYAPADTVIADFAEFPGQTIPDTQQRINQYQQLCRAEWESLPHTDFTQKSKVFYSKSQNYIYDLLAVNTSVAKVREKIDGFLPNLCGRIREHPGKTLLEFGGGTGVFCELAAQLGKSVTYLDIPGVPMNFATWRFQKYAIPMTLHCAQPETFAIPGTYDIIFTDAVIEHLPPADQEAATRVLCDAVRPGGWLIFIVDLTGDCTEFPMHTVVDIKRLHGVISGKGMTCIDGKNRFCSVWTRP